MLELGTTMLAATKSNTSVQVILWVLFVIVLGLLIFRRRKRKMKQLNH